jgi:hypothetical protein
VHSDVIQSFISLINAQTICFKRLKFSLKYTINAFIVYLMEILIIFYFNTLKYTINAFIVYFNGNFNIVKQIGCSLVGLIKHWISLN